MPRKSTHSFPPKPKMNPVLLAASALAIAVVAVLLARLIFSVVHPADQDFERHNYEASVTIAAAGFTPGTISVKPQTRVYFENHDGTRHKLLPTGKEPDSRFVGASVEANAGYGFTFTKKGTYKFYDATNPTANGAVIVQ